MPRRRPNILFLSIDTLRYDVVGAHAHRARHDELGIEKRTVMPGLESWIEAGVFFPSAASVSTYTTSAHASALTGLYPPSHGVRAFFATRLHPDVRTLPQLLAGAGYRTVLMTDVPRFFRFNGLADGFTDVAGSDAELFDLLDEPDDRPVFLLWHSFDVHAP